LVSTLSEVRIIRAEPSELNDVLEILEEASRWLTSKGYETQWHQTPAFRQSIKDSIDQGDVYMVKDAQGTIGTITLQWSDRKYWGEMPPDAGYIHKFAIKRSRSGQRLGIRTLQWAEAKTRKEGKKLLRLDCLANNRTIREYYERFGFVHVRDTIAPGWKASLYEKRL
jgi:GNAT superfamily N-acetyltransferase